MALNETTRLWFNNNLPPEVSTELLAILTVVDVLSGVEAGFIDGVTAGTALASKAVVLDASKGINTITSATITTLTSTTIVVGTASLIEADLLKIDAITNGTVAASKAIVVDANKDFDGVRHATLGANGAGGAAGQVILRDGANPGYAATFITDAQTADLTVHLPDPGAIVNAYVGLSTAALTAAEMDVLDGVTAGTGLASKAAVAGTDGGHAFVGRLTTTDGVASGTAKVIGGRSYSQVAAGTAHTNSTDEAVLGSFTIPANTIKQNTVVKIRYQGIATATNAADTLAVVLRIGTTTLTGTALITHSATDAVNDDIFEGEFALVGRAAPGATAACVGVGSFCGLGQVGTPTRRNAYLASTNLATNGALLVEVTADWSAANAGNSCRLDILNIEIL